MELMTSWKSNFAESWCWKESRSLRPPCANPQQWWQRKQQQRERVPALALFFRSGQTISFCSKKGVPAAANLDTHRRDCALGAGEWIGALKTELNPGELAES